MFVSEKFFELKRVKADEGFIRVLCRADRIFPQPMMSLYSQQREIPEAVVQSRQLGLMYEISAHVTLLELEKPEEFSCVLHIPQANYTTRRETVFYPDVNSAHDNIEIELIEDAPDPDGAIPGSSKEEGIKLVGHSKASSAVYRTRKLQKKTNSELQDFLERCEENRKKEVETEKEILCNFLQQQQMILKDCAIFFIQGIKEIFKEKNNDSDSD